MASNSFGQIFKLTTFGESHGIAMGGVIDGCPAGVKVDLQFLQEELDRRKPGQSRITTERKESDTVQILSGIFEGYTTGTPIGFIIPNEDAKSSDYDDLRKIYRPGHADFTYDKKYGHRDHRGGGRSSARETACRVVAGAFAKMILFAIDVDIVAFVSRVKNIQLDKPFDKLNLREIEQNIIRCPDADAAQKMIALIDEARQKGDSVGGVVSCICKGVPVGWGDPIYEKLHANLGKAMLSINAVKGFEIGDGFESTYRFGSENNDTPDSSGKITNHDGGIQGGVSNGQMIHFNVAFKPTSTIQSAQITTDVNGNQVELSASGRHDPCVLPRAVPVVEAMAALVLVDAMLMSKLSRL
jgi:chorismate synthase